MTTATATAHITDTPRAWVGCLSCYNDGDLVGKWLDDPDEIREYKCPRPTTIYNMHEELWVMDHENMPFINGECNPCTFADAIDKLEEIDDWHSLEAVAAYCSNHGLNWDDFDMSDFEESYRGCWDSAEEYAQEFAEDTGDIDRNATWPHTCIDWEVATRELMWDYWTDRGSEGLHIFLST